MSDGPLFGVAGNPPNFWNSKYGDERANAPAWLASIGLDALEIQCTRGVRMPSERAAAFRANAEHYDIALSIHGPYYISIGTGDEQKVQNSINELKKCVVLAKQIGSRRIIFHPGAIDSDRVAARQNAISVLKRFEDEIELGDVRVYPEVVGKIKQLGSFEDVLEICKAVDCAEPCIDFGHLHARTLGALDSKDAFARVLDEMERVLGIGSLELLHVHLYPIEWGKGGEIRHRAFGEKVAAPDQLVIPGTVENAVGQYYLPRYEEFLELVVERRFSPTIICEAKDSQDVGATLMKQYCQKLAVGGAQVAGA